MRCCQHSCARRVPPEPTCRGRPSMIADAVLPAPRHSLRLPLLAGGAVAACFFGGLGGWAAMAPLAGAALAPAVVAPDGSRKTIQHLEGGIVRRVLVRDGSPKELKQLKDDSPAARKRQQALDLDAERSNLTRL